MTTTWVVLDDHANDVDVSGLPSPDAVVAADSGYGLAVRLGLAVDLLVGDLDSIDPALADLAGIRGVDIDAHPADKDATDLALALRRAAALTPDGDVVVVGSAGGRLDHVLANVVALVDPALAGVAVRARLGAADLFVVRGERRLDLPEGALLTLLPVGGPALGVDTEGLRWPLVDEDLPAGSTRGVSNVVEGPVRVSVRDGVLVAVHPLHHED